jgi:hypothetical protein
MKDEDGDQIEARLFGAVWGETPSVSLQHYTRLDDIVTRAVAANWVVERLVAQGLVYQLFGTWKSGKTIVAVDQALAIAGGVDWAGRRTQQALVVYVAAEASLVIAQRLKGYHHQGLLAPDLPFYLRERAVYLTEPERAADLREEIALLASEHALPVVLYIDTLNRSMGPGRSESSDVDMSAFVSHLLDVVCRPLEATAVVVHHSGHMDKGRGRGHSSFPAAVDGTFSVSPLTDGLIPYYVLELLESRVTGGGDLLTFTRDVVELPDRDNFGNPVIVPVGRFVQEGQPEGLVAKASPAAKGAQAAESDRVSYDKAYLEALVSVRDRQVGALLNQGLPVPSTLCVAITEVDRETRATLEGAYPKTAPESLLRGLRRARAAAQKTVRVGGDCYLLEITESDMADIKTPKTDI